MPFALFGSAIESWTADVITSAHRRPAASALVLGGLLAGDILLPVPSSIVSTACGLLHGFAGGTAVSLTGMSLSCLGGFWLARRLGRPFVTRLVGAHELRRLDAWNRRFGDWTLILARPVPVLAEASVLVVGMGPVTPSRFLLLTTLSNAGISAVYAAVGAWSASVQSFLPALAASLLLPWLVMKLAGRRLDGVAAAERRTRP